MKKKILSLSLVLLIAVMAIAGASMAYFTDNDEKINTFTVGNVEIQINETFTQNSKADPGVPVAKNPSVKNTGVNGAWIRVDVTISDAAAFQAAAEEHQITDLATIFAIAENFDANWKLAGIASDATADTLTYQYYYLTALASGEETPALFTSVTVPAQFDNDDMAAIGDDFTVTITAHAIQAEGLADVETAFANYN